MARGLTALVLLCQAVGPEGGDLHLWSFSFFPIIKPVATEKDKYHMISLMRGILKNDTNDLTRKEQTHRHRKQTYSYRKGKGEG